MLGQKVKCFLRSIYNYLTLNSSMEPWDGPAAIAGTDNEWVIVASDRNGLRPMRYTVTKDKLYLQVLKQA